MNDLFQQVDLLQNKDEIKVHTARDKEEMELLKEDENKQQILKEGMAKFTNILAAVHRRRLKTIDLIIGIFIFINIVLFFAENYFYTERKTTCLSELSTNDLQDYFKFISKPKFYSCKEDAYMNSYLPTSTPISDKVDYPKEAPVYLMDCEDDCILTELTKHTNSSDIMVVVLRWVNLALCIIIIILLILKYRVEIMVIRASNCACKEDSIFTIGTWKYLIIEIPLLGFFIPPGVDGELSGSMQNGTFIYSVDSICLLVSVIKIYHFLRVYANYSSWANENAYHIGYQNKLSIGPMFILKAQFKNSPYICIFVMLVLSLGLLGCILRVFEYGYDPSPSSQSQGKALGNPNFESFIDTFWVIIITMMTIGYGDIFPSTHFGRFVVFIASLAGMTVVSLLIVTMSDFVNFSNQEKKAHTVLQNLKATDMQKKISAQLIFALINLSKIKKITMMKSNIDSSQKMAKKKLANTKVIQYLNQVKKVREIMGELNKFKKIINTQTTPCEDLLCQLDKKLEKDTKVIDPLQLAIRHITDVTNEIIKNERSIRKAITYISQEQEDIANFLVNYNNSQYNDVSPVDC